MFARSFMGLKPFKRSTAYVDDYIDRMRDYVWVYAALKKWKSHNLFPISKFQLQLY